MVQVVSQELGTCTATMPIIDAKEGAGRPRFMLPVLGLDNVENDRNAILVVVSDEALVRIGRIGSDNAIPFIAALCRLMVRDDNSRARC